MKKTRHNAATKEIESKIKEISKKLVDKGVILRRENLTRGPSYRVRSGRCFVNKLDSGKKDCLFIDKRLSAQQQLEIIEERIRNLH